MPKLAVIQTNFTGGEISPQLYGRVDIAKYNNGAARMTNWRPKVQGGAAGRPGSICRGRAKGLARLIPFVYSRAVAYQIEIGDHYLRIWRAADRSQVMSGVLPLELATPYDYAAVTILSYEQAEDTMFFFHNAFMPRRLQRISDTAWRLEAAPFETLPFDELGYSSNVALTLSDVSIGTGRTVAAATPIFLAGDVGRDIDAGSGMATITGYTDSQHVTAEVLSAFDSTALASWILSDSPYAFLYAEEKDPVGSTVNLFAALPRQAKITLSDVTGSITVAADAAVFSSADGGKTLYADAGNFVITYVDSTHISGTVSSAGKFISKTYQAGAWGISGDAFRASDVGAYVRLNSGLFLINAFADATHVTAEIRDAASAVVAAPPGSWSINNPVFDAVRGYPRAGALHEQRLWLAGTPGQPQGEWASRIAEYLNFEPGLNDADAFSYVLSTRQRNPVLHLVSGKRLFVFTSGLEASLRGGNEKAIGPTNIQKDNETNYGCSDVRPVVVGKEVVFVQGAGRKIRAMGYSAAIDGYDSPDRTVFAEHITKTGIVDLAYQQEPDSTLYAVRVDGKMAVAAYDVSQEVVAWAPYLTDGAYTAVSAVPTPAGDDVWTIVNRPYNNVSRYFVEVFDPAVSTDCATSFTTEGGPPVSQLTGLTQLANRSVAVKTDGVYQGMLDVDAFGTLVLPKAASQIEAGLPFVPELELLPPEVQAGGTAQGSNLSVHEVVVRLLDTATIEINGVLRDFRVFGDDLLDQPPPAYTGDSREIRLTDDLYRDKIVIRQPLPFPCQVLAVIRKCTVNDS